MIKFLKSHPTWVRGLKRLVLIKRCSIDKSHPTWVRGLKQDVIVLFVGLFGSHPTWVRGLKHALLLISCCRIVSHPTWVRGLKHRHFRLTNPQRQVAPYVGAWIETERNGRSCMRLGSHPTWVRGLKPLDAYACVRFACRTLRGCVD